jgi:membrane protein
MSSTLNEITAGKYDIAALPANLIDDGSIVAPGDVIQFIREMQEQGKPLICFPEVQDPRGTSRRGFALQQLLADSWQNWNAIDAPRLGAALAYYTLLSLAPLVVLMVAVLTLALPRDIVQGDLLMPVRELMGNEVAELVRAVMENAKLTTGVIAGAVSILVLFVGASGVLLELRDSLDIVWGVKPRYGAGPWSFLRERVFAFLVIIGSGTLLLIFFSLSTILSTPAHLLRQILPADPHVMQALVIVTSFGVMTLVFALIYKIIPDVSLRWSDVWIGSLITSFLFASGKLLISLYLGKVSIGSPYAAAGSILVFLTWVYYSAQIFLLGAEFTHVYALRHGSHAQVANRRGT